MPKTREKERTFFKYIGFLYTISIHVDMEPLPRLRRLAKAKKVTRGPSCKSSVPWSYHGGLRVTPRKSALDYLFYGFVQREIYINVIQIIY